MPHRLVRRGRVAVLAALAPLAVLLALVATAAPASAHPLGNFTVNRYARVEVSAGALRVHYVLDEAEIPTFQDRGALDAGRDAFVQRRLAAIAAGLHVSVDDAPVALRVVGSDLSLPPGQGGLPTLRLVANFAAEGVNLHDGAARHRVTVADDNDASRIGWRELVVEARGDAHVSGSTAPAHDLSDELRHYPADLVQSPLDLRSASFQFTPGTVAVAPSALTAAAPAPKRSGGAFTALIERESVGPVLLVGLLGLALLFGAAHALAPGHGKTVMAAYLVGTSGRPVDALLLGVVVSLMHTFSVLVLGLGLVALGHSVAPERVYPWLTVASGVTVTAVGAWLLLTRRDRLVARLSRGHDHAPVAHTHDQGHDHGHDHGHDDDHGGGHSHDLPDGVAPLSRRGLIALGTSGGLFPSPSAVVVLISAFSLHRAGLGLALIAAFSVGLAVTLTGVGLALVVGRRVVARGRNRRIIELLPLASAAAITLTGVVVTLQGAHKVL